MPLNEKELARLAEQLRQPDEPCYWWIPVNHDKTHYKPGARSFEPEPSLSDPKHSSNVIRRMLGADDDPIVTFHSRTMYIQPHPGGPRAIESGDRFCIYQVGMGIVAHGAFSSGASAEPQHPSNPNPRKRPMVAHVTSKPTLFLNNPIGLRGVEEKLESRIGLTQSRIYRLRGRTHPLTRGDFMLLTGQTKKDS